MMKFLKWAIGILLGLAVVGATIFVFNKGDATFSKSKDKLNGISAMSKNKEFDEYDGKPMNGGDVVSAADLFSTRPQFAVQIITKAVPTGFFAKNTSATTQVCYSASSPAGTTACGTVATTSNMNDTTNANYVNPNAIFNSTIYYDTNGIVRLISFIQQ